MASPKLNFVHLCDTAFLSKDNKLNIIGIFERIYARKFPLRYPKITVVMNLTVGKGNHPFSIQMFKKGKDDPVLKMQGEVKSDAEKSFNLIADFQNIPFEDQREYRVEIVVKELKLATLVFAVALMPRPENPSSSDV